MSVNNNRIRVGVALLLVAGVLLFAPLALGLPYAHEVGALSVLGLAAGAVLIGTADDERPV